MKPLSLFLDRDARILDLIRKGDEEGLVLLYQSARRPVTSFILKNSGTADDAEDMLQEALIVLWERVKTGRFEHSAKLDTFVFATVRNMWLRRLSQMRRETPGMPEGTEALSDDPDGFEQLAEADRVTLVERSLELLGEPCRTLLLLFYWEELSMEEIARKMGFANADTAKSKKYQCKKALETLIRPYE